MSSCDTFRALNPVPSSSTFLIHHQLSLTTSSLSFIHFCCFRSIFFALVVCHLSHRLNFEPRERLRDDFKQRSQSMRHNPHSAELPPFYYDPILQVREQQPHEPPVGLCRPYMHVTRVSPWVVMNKCSPVCSRGRPFSLMVRTDTCAVLKLFSGVCEWEVYLSATLHW
jgi:hypothetical protein